MSPATLVAIAAVALVAVGSLARIFAGFHYLAWALPAVAVGAGIAFLYGRRSLGGAFAAAVLAWALSLSPLFARRATYHGLPSPSALRAVRNLLASGLQHAAQESLPVAPSPRYMVLVWTALLFLGFLGASWVIVRRPVGAVVTCLGVVAFSGGIGIGRGRDAVAVAAVAATGAFFLAEGRQRIERWGRSRAPVWFGVPTLIAASAFAAAAPMIFGEGPAITINSPLRARLIIIKPLSDVRRQLKVDPPLEVMRVTASRPMYWRLTALDTYDGHEWLLRAHPRTVAGGAVPPPKEQPTGDNIAQRYTLTSLLAPWLPAAYSATKVDQGVGVDVDTTSQTLLLHGNTHPGLQYFVVSTIPRVRQNIQIPLHPSSDGIEKAFANIARPIVAGARTPLDVSRRLERHFRTFTYDENVPGGHSVARLQSFLQQRRGYCEQFAATMTLMLRGLGVPARVGVGFLPGGTEGGGEYVVTTREAHAWVEADIPGAGWTTFDPTPGRGSTASVPPAAQEHRQTQVPPPPPRINRLTEPTPSVGQLPNQVTTQRKARSIPVGRFVPYVVALAILAAPSVAKLARRRRRRAARHPRVVVLGAFAELADRAADLGWTHAPSETQREYCRRLFGADPAGAQLAEVAMRALYGPGSITVGEATAAWQALGSATSSLRRRAPVWRRLLAAFDPRTLLPQLWVRRAWEVLLRQTPTGRPSSI